MNVFTLLTPLTYWILILVWSFILVFYLKKLRSSLVKDRLLFLLLIILAIDAFRTLFESVYFGAWYTALAGFLPKSVHTILIRPEMVFIPKIINVVAAILVIAILLFRWLPREVAEKDHLEKAIRKHTLDLMQNNEILQKEIKERKQVQEKLLESETKCRGLLDNSPDIIYRTDTEGRIVFISRSVFKLSGYREEETLGIKLAHLFQVDEVTIKNFLALLTDKGEVNDFEALLKRKDGSPWWAATNAHFYKDLNGKHLGVEGVVRDVTNRKHSEEKLKESELRHRVIFENSPLGMIFFDAQGTMVNFNDNFVNIMGSTREKLMGFNTARQSTPKMQAIIKQALAGNVAVFEDKYISVTGKRARYLRVVFNPVNPGQNPTQVIATLEDITQRKKIEKQLQQAQRMEAIGTLSGGIAHDFNNILSPLLGFAELMKEDLPKDSPLLDNVDEILGAAIRAKDLVKQILIFSRPGDQNKKPIILQHVIEEALKLLRSTIPSTIDIKNEICRDEITVFADPTQIHQIVMNLVTNSFHAMEITGGKLTLVLKKVIIDADQIDFPELRPGEYAQLMISDTGMGIPKNLMDKIFNPYFTTKQVGKGSGIGLSVVLGIVRNNNGAIRVYSEPKKGTNINVYIPVFKQGVRAQSITASPPIPGGSEHILLVDDEKAIVRMEKMVLERMGYCVTAHTDSVDALKTFSRSPESFDLLVSDMTMPGLTGIQLIKEIRKIRPKIPVVICTGFSDQVDKEKSREMGIQGYILKPVVKLDMAEAIRCAIDNGA